MLFRFVYLKPALAVLLVFIGSKVFVADLMGWSSSPPTSRLGAPSPSWPSAWRRRCGARAGPAAPPSPETPRQGHQRPIVRVAEQRAVIDHRQPGDLARLVEAPARCCPPLGKARRAPAIRSRRRGSEPTTWASSARPGRRGAWAGRGSDSGWMASRPRICPLGGHVLDTTASLLNMARAPPWRRRRRRRPPSRLATSAMRPVALPTPSWKSVG